MSGALTIIVTGPDQSDKRFTFEERELAIGRAAGNDIQLRDINVSRRHARVVVHDGKYIIIDVVSTNGTFVNGRQLTSPMVIGRHDRVQIGRYTLAIEAAGAERTEELPLAPFIPRDPTEAALLRAIGEGDEGSRQVYGDWLEERGHVREAEFIRLQQALVAMAPEAVGFEARSHQLRELARMIDFRWRVRVARPAIERCAGTPMFDFRCPKDWGSLAPTDREDVRHCGACKTHVYYCTSVPEARGRAARGECVALDLRAVRWRGDVEPPYGVEHCPTCRADVGEPPDDECPRCGESLIRRMTVGMIA
jgi:uncharacterized protein (TIGR02996 family)